MNCQWISQVFDRRGCRYESLPLLLAAGQSLGAGWSEGREMYRMGDVIESYQALYFLTSSLLFNNARWQLPHSVSI
jgi:hypothetical protein